MWTKDNHVDNIILRDYIPLFGFSLHNKWV